MHKLGVLCTIMSQSFLSVPWHTEDLFATARHPQQSARGINKAYGSDAMFRRRFLIGAASLVLSGCAGFGLGNRDLESPEVTLSDIQFRGAGLLEQQLGLVLRLRNPNDADLPLRGLKVKLNIDGEPFATGLSDERVTVPALGEKTVTVEAVSSTSELLNQLRGVSGLKDIRYTIAGTAFLRGESDRKLPFEQKGVLRLSGLQ